MWSEKELHYKFCGVTPSQLAALHEAIEKEEVTLKKLDACEYDPKNSHNSVARVEFVEILSSKLKEAGSSRYTIQIKILCGVDCYVKDEIGNYKRVTLYPSISMMQAIYDALDIFPKELKMVEK